MKILITGGAGFIGSQLIRTLIDQTHHDIVNLDALTYAADLSSLESVSQSLQYCFEKCDICDFEAVSDVFRSHQPDLVVHLAAETHVDNSIENPLDFMQTNIVGTSNLLRASVNYLRDYPNDKFRFLHVSTDEVYGSLGSEGFFTEDSAYNPSSPYSASKASSDHLVRAWYRTYGLPVLITHCSNNFGPYQSAEKLIPNIISRALMQNPINIYGTGQNIRDWLFVEDHALALMQVLEFGHVGHTYCIGANSERTNLEIAYAVCNTLNAIKPREEGSYEDLITFVQDRPGHDYRYALDATKLRLGLKWQPRYEFEEGLRNTVQWYANNISWLESSSKKINKFKPIFKFQ